METVLLVLALTFTFTQSVTSTITFHVVEEVPLGTFVGNILSASNLTSNLTSSIVSSFSYNILSPGGDTRYFSLNSSSGILTSDRRIDREQICGSSATCDLHFDVVIKSTFSSVFKILNVVVVIIDINDNAPFFRSSPMVMNLSEALAVGVTITIETAEDKDVGINSVQSYELIPSSSPFTIQLTTSEIGDHLLMLKLKEPLDREKQDSYALHIKAFDGGTPSLFAVLHVMINIQDINDNAPVFTQSLYNISVQDNIRVNTSILGLRAIDRDTGENGHIVYRFSPNQSNTNITEIHQIFRIVPFFRFAIITVVAPLQNYQGRSFEFQVEARDSGVPVLVSKADVIVRVLNAGNTRPVMKLHFFNIETNGKPVVSEYATIDASVALIEVGDKTTGNNVQVYCAVNDTHFWLQDHDQSINRTKELLMKTKSKLDRERMSHIFVQITCTNQGTPATSSVKNFEIVISDENDNVPRFTQSIYPATISENNQIGDVITQVSASDSDVGKNAVLSYFLSPETQHFAIDSKTGIVTAKSVFDREQISSFAFSVFAKDNGLPPLTGTATVILNITDINDNPPLFSVKSYEFYVMKIVPIGTVVGQVAAFDPDAKDNGRISFSLSPPNNITTVPFEITSGGLIKTVRTLESETRSEFNLSIIAVDHGQPQMRSSVSACLRVIDDNGQTLIG